MSRGPGRIERALYDLFEEHPEGAWTTADLCRLIYPTANRVDLGAERTKTTRFQTCALGSPELGVLRTW